MTEQAAQTPPSRTIRFPGNANPSLIASRDETRWILEHVLIQDRHAIATDGRMLICMQIQDTWSNLPVEWSPQPMLIPKAVVAAAVRKSPDILEPGELTFIGDTATIEFLHPAGQRTYQMSDADAANYPHWKQVIPTNTTGRITLGLNARFLRRIARALGDRDQQVLIHLDPQNPASPLFVTVPDNRTSFAILMPLKSKNDEPYDADAILAGNHALNHALGKETP